MKRRTTKPLTGSEPEIFIGSATEHKAILARLEALRTRGGARYVPWTAAPEFGVAGYTLTSLCRVFEAVDGAAFLTLSVDKTWWRGESVRSPRDNVVFEAGLAIGCLGLERTAIVTDSGAKLPSDLKGLNTIRFRRTGELDRDVQSLHERLDQFFSQISTPKRLIRRMWDQGRYAIYFHSFDNPEKAEVEEVVNFNAVRAVGHLSEMFGKSGIGHSFHSSRLDDLNVEENLVLLGSGASNALTKRLCDSQEGRWRFCCLFDPSSMQDRSIYDHLQKVKYETEFVDNRVARDYGVLTKVRNPFNSRYWVIIASGNYGFGTLAALRVVIDIDDLSTLSFRLDSEFQLLVSVQVTGRFSCGRPQILAGSVIPSG